MRKKAAWVVLFAVALLGAGCSRTISDKQVATNIKVRMFSDRQLTGSMLNVQVKKGVATLSGQVPSVAARYEAFKVASETKGVKKVVDQMTIEEPGVNSQSASTASAAATEAGPKRRHARARHVRRFEPDTDVTATARMPAKTNAPQSEPAPNAVPPAPASAANIPIPAQSSPVPVERITIPQGTRVDVRMIDSASSAINHTGDILHASLEKPIRVKKQLVAPVGTNVYLRLVEVRSAGHLGGHGELRLELYRMVIQGTSYPVISNDYVDKGPSRIKRTVLAILGGSAIGAAVGAIAGGGKGAAIGAAAGTGGGAIYQGATQAKPVDIPSETSLKFKLEQPASVTISPAASQPNTTVPSVNTPPVKAPRLQQQP